MSVLKKRPIGNRPRARLHKSSDLCRPVEKLDTAGSYRPRESGLTFVDDFTREHYFPGLLIHLTEISGIF